MSLLDNAGFWSNMYFNSSSLHFSSFSPSAPCCFHTPKHCLRLPSHFPCCLDLFSSCCEQEDPTYFAIWGDNKAFNEVIISPAMLHEHLPYVVMEGLNKVRERIAIPKNTGKAGLALECCWLNTPGHLFWRRGGKGMLLVSLAQDIGVECGEVWEWNSQNPRCSCFQI